MTNLTSAFAFALYKKRRSATIERNGTHAEIPIYLTPSNYLKNKNLPENMSSEMLEYIISYDQLKNTDYNPPMRGDLLVIGSKSYAVSEVEELSGLGLDNIFGWRLKVE